TGGTEVALEGKTLTGAVGSNDQIAVRASAWGTDVYGLPGLEPLAQLRVDGYNRCNAVVTDAWVATGNEHAVAL
ncbi:MAG TPA: hypothetical protein VFH51_15910, partial [Myxococcota bacterium]|nr:hypothetical protein [Myxococcota bacterium]